MLISMNGVDLEAVCFQEQEMTLRTKKQIISSRKLTSIWTIEERKREKKSSKSKPKS